jgi:hypothetical protein
MTALSEVNGNPRASSAEFSIAGCINLASKPGEIAVLRTYPLYRFLRQAILLFLYRMERNLIIANLHPPDSL